MSSTSVILFIAGFYVLACVIASKISSRLGIPTLIVFLCIGMLAGEDGIGKIEFNNAAWASQIGTLSLAFILFYGGLSTHWRVIRPLLFRGVLLATVGVALTAGFVGLFVCLILGFNLLQSMLLGAIISSTDAAAVFAILRSKGISLKGDLRPLLELESGSNDPMAVFLTLGLTQALTISGFEWQYLFPAFFLNMLVGLLVGAAVGRIAAYLFNRIHLDHDGLYPVMSISLILLTFGAAEILHGNGFLAVYICGIMLNASDFAFKRAVEKFHDGLAWLMQITLFITLGLLVTPSELPGIALQGLLASLFLMFVARPLAVHICLFRSAFSHREQLLASWAGLRGAVPIVLATFPLLAGYADSNQLFNIVFFIVLTSVLVQGSFLMPVARFLKVDETLESRPLYSLEIARSGRIQGETREIQILPHMALVGHAISDLVLPEEVLILLIGRGDEYVVPRGQTRIEPYDTLLLLGKPSALLLANAMILSPTPPKPKRITEDPMRMLPMSTDDKYLSRQVVLVGYGNLGKRICTILVARQIPVVVVDLERSIVERLRAQGQPAVTGDAAVPMVLVQAHIARASVLVIAIPDAFKTLQMVETARIVNPDIDVLVRSQCDMETSLFAKENIRNIFLAEEELARNITEHIQKRLPS